jgi:RNA polymerase sigma factor (sigma-70 family)
MSHGLMTVTQGGGHRHAATEDHSGRGRATTEGAVAQIENTFAFAATRWSIVQQAAGESGQADAALESLCRTYWQPLHNYVRRRGYSPQDAEDLTQSFFARLLSKNYLSAVDRRKGKFRSFLLAALDHFLANQWRDARAQKRGGGFKFVSYQAEIDESELDRLEFSAPDATRLFERDWAMTLLNQVLNRLREEFASSGRAEIYEDLKGILAGESTALPYVEIATRRGMTEAAVKMTAYRLKKRYGELLLAELSNTLSSSDDVAEELRALFAALS